MDAPLTGADSGQRLSIPGAYCRVCTAVASWTRLRHDLRVATTIDMPGFGKAVAERRKAVGKTQEDLAYEADVSLRHLQKIEAGATNPRLGTLLTLARILGVKPQRLLDSAEDLQRPRRR